MGGFSYTAAMDQSLPSTQLDVRAFARSGGSQRGAAALSAFVRVVHDCVGAGVDRTVQWSVEAALRGAVQDAAQPVLHLCANTVLPMTCQRCLEPLDVEITVNQSFRFVADEESAAEQDEDSPEDLLVESAQFNLRELLEDELVLAMPLIPVHLVCPAAPRMSVRDAGFEDAADAKEHAFAALAKLRDGKGGA